MKIFLGALVLVLFGCATDMAAGVDQLATVSVDASVAGADVSAVDTTNVSLSDAGTIDTVDAVIAPTCATNCDDNNLCTIDACVKGECHHDEVPLEEWKPCVDDDPCTYPDACIYGKCGAVGKVNCDDKNPCTVDVCTGTDYQDPKGCTHTPMTDNTGTKTCDDDNACSFMDHCQGGECKGVLDACDDFNPCSTDSCDKYTGICEHTPVQDGTTCDDSNGCTKMDKCQAGKCAGQMPMYSFEPKSDADSDAFTCIPCVDDSECQFKNDTFCPSSYGPPSYGPNFAYHSTGKCISNSCEFKMVWCSDGDLSTYDYCVGGVGSTYPNMKAGVCKSTKISAGTNVKTQECWCTGDTEMKCIEYTVTAGAVSNEKDAVFSCPNGCGPECKGFKDQLGYGGYFKQIFISAKSNRRSVFRAHLTQQVKNERDIVCEIKHVLHSHAHQSPNPFNI